MEKTQKVKITKNKESRTVLIIGGGFGGVRAALDLLKSGNKNIKVVLADKNRFHSYHPDYYEVAAAILKEYKKPNLAQFCEVRSTVAISFEEIFKNYENIEILNDEIISVDFEKNAAETAHKKRILYDWLVAAAGSETNFFNIPNLKNVSLELKSVNDALNIRNRIDELFEQKSKNSVMKILVGGGGFTGCELAAEMTGYLKRLTKIHNKPKNHFSVEIMEVSPTILGGASAWAQKETKKRLESLGAKIILNNPIKNLTDGEAVLGNGETVKFDLLIWTAGVKANKISELFNENPSNPKNCLEVDKHLNVKKLKNVFAVGDMAYCFDKTKKSPLPMTAQTAISQGEYAAYAILGNISGKKLKPYNPKQSKFIIPLGGKFALADLGFIKFSGFFAWALKHIVTLSYFLSILPINKAISLWVRGLKIYIRND